MADFTARTDVAAPSEQLFQYLSEVANLPKYFSRMTSAQTAGDGAVHVSADLGGGRTVGGTASFDVDDQAQSIRWASEGPNDYAGRLQVSGDASGSSVEVTLSTARAGGEEIQHGLEETLANIKRLVEGG